MMMNREAARETFRAHILAAMDEVGAAMFGELPTCGAHSQGATDADLPELFKGLDAQLDRLCERYNVALVDYDPAAYAAANPIPTWVYNPK